MMAVRAFLVAVGTPSPPGTEFGSRRLFNMSDYFPLAPFMRINPYEVLWEKTIVA